MREKKHQRQQQQNVWHKIVRGQDVCTQTTFAHWTTPTNGARRAKIDCKTADEWQERQTEDEIKIKNEKNKN